MEGSSAGTYRSWWFTTVVGRWLRERCGSPCKTRNGNVTLYTARHQFSANAKSSDGLTRTEIAALMGHASIYTAGEHYGKRRSGRGRLGVPRSEAEVDASERQTLVFPHVDDLRMVQALEQERQRRREQRTTSKLGPGMG